MTAKARIAVLHVAKRELGLSDDDYRAILSAYGGAASARDLGERGFDAVMDRFRTLGFTSTARRGGFGERDGMATPPQIALIRRLWGEVAPDPTEARLNVWLERFGVSALRFTDYETARKVIGGLRSWKSRLEGRANES